MLKLSVAHPDGDFEAEYDPQLRCLFSTEPQGLDLLWGRKFPEIFGDHAELAAIGAAVIVGRDDEALHPGDRLDKALLARALTPSNRHELRQSYENASDPHPLYPQFESRSMDAQSCRLHNDRVFSTVMTRAYDGAPSTLIAAPCSDREMQHLFCRQKADSRIISGKSAKANDFNTSGMFNHWAARNAARFPWFQPASNTLAAFAGNTYHARPGYFKPRLFSRGSIIKDIVEERRAAIRAVSIQPIRYSKLRHRALAVQHIPLSRFMPISF